MSRYLSGAVFCSLWFMSIFSGFLLIYCPLLPLLFTRPTAFRRITDAIFAAWELYPVALVRLILRTKIVVTGDRISAEEGSLLIMNHRTRLDWNFLWSAMFHACQPLKHRLKFVLKAPIRLLPGPGWVMQMCCFLYIHRRWERDKVLLKKTMDYLSEIDYTYQVLLFPEGTDLTLKSQKRSHEFAEAHHLERYYQVLHPKTTGFVFLAERMRHSHNLGAVYDLSIGYPKQLPQGEVDLLLGNFPEEVHFHITRHSADELPRNEAALKEWLATVWRRKEATLARFYEVGHFEDVAERFARREPPAGEAMPSPDYDDLRTPTTPPESSPPSTRTSAAPRHVAASAPLLQASWSQEFFLLVALIFWTALSGIACVGLLFSPLFRVYAITHCIVFSYLSYSTEGMQVVEIAVHDFWKKVFGGD